MEERRRTMFVPGPRLPSVAPSRSVFEETADALLRDVRAELEQLRDNLAPQSELAAVTHRQQVMERLIARIR